MPDGSDKTYKVSAGEAKQADTAIPRELETAIIEHYRKCWTAPADAARLGYTPLFRVTYALDGSLEGEPVQVDKAKAPRKARIAAAALAALKRCSPIPVEARFLPYYREWKTRILRFGPD